MNAPGILLGYQKKWMLDKSTVRVWEKSRRIGASWVCACEAVIDAAREKGSDTWYTSYNKETTAEFIRDCADWCAAINMAFSAGEEAEEDSDGNQVLTYVIRFASGYKITTLSSKPSALRNRKGRIIIDEAAHRDDLEEVIKAATAVRMWGGRYDIISTHNGVATHFNKIVTDIKEGRKSYSLHTTDLDDALDDGLFKRICLVRGIQWSRNAEEAWFNELVEDYGDHADEELFCIPSKSGGTYLSRLVLEDRLCSVPVFRFEAPDGFAMRDDDQRSAYMQDWLDSELSDVLRKLPKGLTHAFGEDFGRTADLTVIAPITTEQDLHRHIPFLVELRNTPYREQEQALYYIVDRLPRFAYGALDQTGNGQYLAERAWQRYGASRIECINLTDKWYSENLPPLKKAFDDAELDAPKDADVLSDLLSFQTIDGIPKLPKSKKKQIAESKMKQVAKRHGDAGIAIALAYYATRRPGVSYAGYKSISKRSSTRSTRSTGRERRTVGFKSRRGGLL